MKEHEIRNLPLGRAFRSFVDILISGYLGLECVLGHMFFNDCSFMAFVDLVRSLPVSRSIDALRPCFCGS